MADLQKTVEIVFGGRNELTSAIGDVERSLNGLTNATQPFADLAVDALKAEAAIIAFGVAAAGLSIAKAGEFAGEFAEITTLIDGSADSLGDYRQAILDYSTTSTQSLSDINSALYAAISAGVDYSDSLSVMTVAEQLAVAGKADLGSTMTALVSVINAYGASMDEAGDYADILFTAVKEGQTTVPELANSLAQVTNIAAAAGVPFADLSAAIAALTASGMPTSEAITSIRAALSNIIKPSSEAQKMAEELGIQFNSTALESMGLAGFLDMVWEATDGNIDVMASLFGSVKGLAGVLSLAGDESGRFAGALEAMASRTGATEAAYAKMVDTVKNQNQQLINNLDVVLVGVGSRLLDEYGDIINALIRNLQGIGSAINAGHLDGLIRIFETAMADIAQIFNGIADVLPEALAQINWSGLEASFDNLKSAVQSIMQAIFGDVDLTTVDGLASGIQKFVDGLAGLNNINAGIISQLPPLFSAIVGILDQISKLSPEQFEMIGKGLGAALLINVGAGVVSDVAVSVASFLVSIKALAGVNIAGLTSLAGALARLGLIGGAAYVGFELGQWIEEQVYKLRNGVDELDKVDLDIMLPTFDTADLVKGFDDVVEAARQTAFETGKIQWELDADGNIAGTVNKIVDEITSITAITDPEFERIKASFIAMGNSPDVAASMARFELEAQRMPNAIRDAATEVEKESDAVKIALAKLDSDFARDALKFTFELEVAQLQADAEVAGKIIDNIGTTITSTGNLLASLFDNLVSAADGPGGFGDKWAIEKQIKEENRRRDEALELQKQMTDAQIALMEARTSALKGGDGLIKISSDGLEPALEMIMWQVLEKVQLRVNEEGSALLLGI